MKTFRTIGVVLALAAASALAACSTVATPGGPPPVDAVAVVQAGLAAAKVGIVALEQSGRIDPVSVAKFRADADAVLALVVAVGPIASLADPKLLPALQALTALQTAIAASRAEALRQPAPDVVAPVG
jgi:hypothetical protein